MINLNFKNVMSQMFKTLLRKSLNPNIKILSISMIVLISSSMLILVLKTHAQENEEGLDITVSPPVIEINANPGESVTNNFRIRNNQATPMDLSISVKKLIANDFNGEPVPAEPDSTDDFIDWVTIEPSTLTAQPNEWQNINFTIDIPESAAFGYYYVLQISPNENSGFRGTGAQVQGEVLIVTLLNVKKEGAIAKGELIEFKPSSFISEYLPVEFTARVENKGNIHIRPWGNVFIRSLSQEDTGILEINQNKSTILPDGTRSFSTSWSDGFIVREPVMDGEKVKLDSTGKPEMKIKINWNKLTEFRFGRYTATLFMVYDDGQRDATIEGTATFWLIPYTAIAVIIISLIAIFFLIKFLLRWYINKELRRQRRYR